jgi:hypothetical protein
MKTDYLPSKQFRLRLALLVALVAVVMSVYELFTFIHNRQLAANQATPLAIKDLVQKDSNNNGIPDWEEALWGLDPTKNGDTNKEFIMAKRQALTQGADAQPVPASQSTPENQQLAQDFFATLMTLQQTGNLDDNSLQTISDAIGQKITAPAIPDVYTVEMAKQVPLTKASYNAYVIAYSNLLIKYKDANIGNELSYIDVGLQNKDPGALAVAQKIATSYRAFGKDLMATPVPDFIAATNVSLANNYDKTGQSIGGLTQILSDPIVGMKAVINYKKYNDALINDINTLSDKLTQ